MTDNCGSRSSTTAPASSAAFGARDSRASAATGCGSSKRRRAGGAYPKAPRTCGSSSNGTDRTSDRRTSVLDVLEVERCDDMERLADDLEVARHGASHLAVQRDVEWPCSVDRDVR